MIEDSDRSSDDSSSEGSHTPRPAVHARPLLAALMLADGLATNTLTQLCLMALSNVALQRVYAEFDAVRLSVRLSGVASAPRPAQAALDAVLAALASGRSALGITQLPMCMSPFSDASSFRDEVGNLQRFPIHGAKGDDTVRCLMRAPTPSSHEHAMLPSTVTCVLHGRKLTLRAHHARLP